MEKIALIIIVVLAALYGIAMFVFTISIFPFGILPLLGLLAMALFFFIAVRDKLNNPEDKKYDEKVEP